MIAITLAGLATSAPANAEVTSDWKLNDCIKENAVALGKDNQEDAATVVRAAFTKCKDELEDARKLAGVFHLTSTLDRSFAWASNQNALLERWKEAATNEGIAAVLEARDNRATNPS
jgi:hypothetical protein